jgi:hypothetical protein
MTATTNRICMNPPIVKEVTIPRSQRTINMTAMRVNMDFDC